MAEQDVKQLLRDGIEASRANDKKKARELFEKVTELDENNEKGWLWLASVLDTDEERRICLANVLQINPDNERAQKEMAKLETKMQKTKADEEVMPGITRGQMTLYAGGGAVLVVVVIALILILIISRNAAEAAVAAEATAGAQLIVDAQNTGTAVVAAATDAAQALITPTAEPTDTPPFPTWTPTATIAAAVEPTALAQPVGLTGVIAGWTGRDILGEGFISAALFPLDGGGQFTTIGTESVRDVRLNPLDGQRVIYTRYFSTTLNFGLEMINSNGTQAEPLSLRFGGCGLQLINEEHPYFSPDGTKVVFVAQTPGSGTRQVFMYDFSGVPIAPTPDPAIPTAVPDPNFTPPAITSGSCALTQLTQDAGDYTYPAISPDGLRIAVVRDDANSLNPGADIVIIDLATRTITAQVTTTGGDYIEKSIVWQDNAQIAYAFAPANDPENHDIALGPADASGATPLIVARDAAADDQYPVFSPDGQYLAFASNRGGGAYDIYIYGLETGDLFQLTDTDEEEDYPGSWYVDQ